MDIERSPSGHPSRYRPHPAQHRGQRSTKCPGPRGGDPAGATRRPDPKARLRPTVATERGVISSIRTPVSVSAATIVFSVRVVLGAHHFPIEMNRERPVLSASNREKRTARFPAKARDPASSRDIRQRLNAVRSFRGFSGQILIGRMVPADRRSAMAMA